MFNSLHTNNRIFLLRIFLKLCIPQVMYMSLKGIGKILFVSVLRILLICKTLNFMAGFTKKKLKFPKFAFNFLCGKVNFSLTDWTRTTIHSFWRSLLSSSDLPVVSKSYIQTNSKTSDYWIFLISKSSPIHMTSRRTQTDSYWNTCPGF